MERWRDCETLLREGKIDMARDLEVDVLRGVGSRVTYNVKIKRQKEMWLRWRIAMLLVRIAARITYSNIEVILNEWSVEEK